MPIFPFHTWLPDAHVEAPTAGSVVLAGVMLKIGTYGFLRFAVPFFPQVALSPGVSALMVTLAVIGVIYGALVALVQPDIKKLVAYSSVSHLGFVMLGIWGGTMQSVQGALMVMISHGFSTGALFLLIGMLYERRHTRLIADYGGIARVVPIFSLILTVVALSSIGLPGLNGFVGEFLVLLGSFAAFPWATGLATTGVIFAAAYLLWALQRMIFNRLDDRENEHLTDLTPRELAVMLPLIVGIVWLGLYPAPVLRRMEPATRHYLEATGVRAAPGAYGAGAGRPGGGGPPMTRIDLSTPWGVTVALLPEVLLCGWALVVLLVVSWRHRTEEDSRLAGWLSFAGVVLAAAGLAALWVNDAPPDGLAQMVALDGFRYAAAAIALISAGATILLSLGYLERERLLAPEYYPLVLLATAGMMFLGGAEDLIVLFLGLEVMSVAVYVLAGYNREQRLQRRGRAQVFPHRRLRLGVPALRHRAGLRRDRRDQPLHRRRPARRQAAAAHGRVGAGPAADRVRLQGRRGAVPHVGAGRLRRLPHADHGLHGHRASRRRRSWRSCGC